MAERDYRFIWDENEIEVSSEKSATPVKDAIPTGSSSKWTPTSSMGERVQEQLQVWFSDDPTSALEPAAKDQLLEDLSSDEFDVRQLVIMSQVDYNLSTPQLYRGVSGPEHYSVGQSLDMAGLTSWSSSEDIGARYAASRDAEGTLFRVPFVYSYTVAVCDHLRKDGLFMSDDHEFIIFPAGFKVLAVENKGDFDVVDLTQDSDDNSKSRLSRETTEDTPDQGYLNSLLWKDSEDISDEVSKFNPDQPRDERGRFGSGGSSVPESRVSGSPMGTLSRPSSESSRPMSEKLTYSSPPKTMMELQDRLYAMSKAEGVVQHVEGIQLPTTQSEAQTEGLPRGAGGVATWENVIVMSPSIGNSIKQVMESGEIKGPRQLDAMEALRHETIHETGVDRGQTQYQTSRGRILEEGLTQSLAERTTIQWARDLGFKTDVEPQRITASMTGVEIYTKEVSAVDQLAAHLAIGTGRSPEAFLSELKYNTQASQRFTVASKYLAQIHGGSSDLYVLPLAQAVDDSGKSTTSVRDYLRSLSSPKKG